MSQQDTKDPEDIELGKNISMLKKRKQERQDLRRELNLPADDTRTLPELRKMKAEKEAEGK